MSSRTAMISLLLLALLSVQKAHADNEFWLGIKAGTLGLGAELTWRPLPWFDMRGGFNTFDYDDEGTEAGIDYDSTLDLQTTYLTANFLLPATPFRLTAGYFSNDNELLLQSRESGSITIGDSTFPTSDVGTLRGRTSFRSSAPYFGLGLDFGLFGRVGMTLDAGVLLQGEPDVVLAADGPIADDPDFLEALEDERRDLQNEVDDFEVYPVASIGFNVRFN